MLLRRISPLAAAAVLVLLAPGSGRASSFSPDPPPGASAFRPDPAPSAPQPSLPVSRGTAVAPPPAPVRVVTTQAPVRSTPRPPRKQPVERARPHTGRLALPKLELPPVVVPAFVSAPLRYRPQFAELAALALALAALTAGSGAGLVRAWSRR